MFSGTNRTSSATWHVQDSKLTVRPYNEKLNELTSSICEELGHGGSDLCKFETRTAFDCVLRARVRKGANEIDNVGGCKHHIENMKAAVSRSEHASRMLDTKLNYLNEMR